MGAQRLDLAALHLPAALSVLRLLFWLLRWLLALPLRFLGHRYVRIGGVLAITAGFLAARPTDPAFYGVCGGFLLLSFLARPLGRWLTPRRRPPALPSGPSQRFEASELDLPPPSPAVLPDRPPRPAPELVAVYSINPSRSPGEREIRARLPTRLQALLSASPSASPRELRKYIISKSRNLLFGEP